MGLYRGVDAWVQVPFHHSRYDDAAGERTSSGPGDPRVFLRAGPEVLGLPPVPIAVRGGVKWPGGDFDVDAEVIPLGEGQRDVELLLEVGRSFYPLPIWAAGWAGYRWRGPNRTTAQHPGNERFWYATAGGTLERIGWKVAMEGVSGDPWHIQGIRIPTATRELTQGFFSLDLPIAMGRMGAGVRTTFRGRNLPAGTALTLHYFFRWGN